MDKSAVRYRAHADVNTSLVYVPLDADDFANFLRYTTPFLQRNGLEVIIGIRKSIDQEGICQEILRYPFINWILLGSDADAVCSIVNACIAQVSKENLLIVHSPSGITGATFDKIKYYAFHYRHRFFAVNAAFDRLAGYGHVSVPDLLFVPVPYLRQVGTLHEAVSWPYSLIHFMWRLQHAGIRCFKFNNDLIPGNAGTSSSNFTSGNVPKETFYPLVPGKQEKQREVHCRVMYSWKMASYGYQRCCDYVKQFKQAEIQNKDCFDRHYRVIVLLQTYNEMKNMPAILRHLENYSDGIILLDDESTDGTYENATSDKLLLKVQKERFEFDDIGNRNILLNLVSFFNLDWIYTMDADERLDPRYDDIFGVASNSDADILSFYYVNLWNDPHTYRADYETSENKDGIFHRRRMFRNIGRAQIHLMENKKLHFNPVPLVDNPKRVKILVLHHGTLDSTQRKNKYDFYLKEDSSDVHYNTYYKFLTEGDIVLNKVENIKL